MTRAARPRPAASLILLRGREVLMGRRASRHRFAPDQFVFPGGVVDAADGKAPSLTELRPEVVRRLEADTSRGRAFAVAAVRETWEETGLVLGEAGPSLLPALDRLDYVMRAITPSVSPIRYEARFFVADAAHFTGELKSNGELLELGFRPIEQCLGELPILDVTQHVLESLRAGFDPRAARVPLFCFHGGRSRVIREGPRRAR